jgi:hypothetical protein
MTSLADVREIAGSLPETEEILTWGSDVTFRVRGKIFAIGGDDSDSLSVKATPVSQAELIDLDPHMIAVESSRSSSAFWAPVIRSVVALTLSRRFRPKTCRGRTAQ